jgi:hypothetical protein
MASYHGTAPESIDLAKTGADLAVRKTENSPTSQWHGARPEEAARAGETGNARLVRPSWFRRTPPWSSPAYVNTVQEYVAQAP